MKLVFLIAAICFFAIAAVLGFTVEDVELRDVEALGLVGGACLSASFLPV